jgi:hypothetical protein
MNEQFFQPENFHFGGGATQSHIHPLVVVAMFLTILVILIGRRRQVLLAFLLVSILVPFDQVVVYSGAHFTVPRILVMAGCLRLLMEKAKAGKLFPNGLNTIDKAFIIWAVYRGLAFLLLFHVMASVPLQVALWIQQIGGYFFLRYLIQDVEDISTAAKALASLVVMVGACMSIERFYGINVFGYVHSGPPLLPNVRNGVIRAQAFFGHAILAGCFGATLLPLFYGLWKSGKAKILAAVAMVGSTLMVFSAGSSTPVFACVGGLLALFFWPLRRYMRRVRWGMALALVALALVMKAPVWFLIARVNVTGSSDAYGRAMLVDNFYRHFGDWWLIGTNENYTWGEHMWDTCNAFVTEGQTGGLLTLSCFIALSSLSFGRLGKMRRQVEGDNKQEWFYWCLCAVLVAHLFAFFGVSYFDQSQTWWFAFLAMVTAATAGLKAEKRWEIVEEPSLKAAASA